MTRNTNKHNCNWPLIKKTRKLQIVIKKKKKNVIETIIMANTVKNTYLNKQKMTTVNQNIY